MKRETRLRLVESPPAARSRQLLPWALDIAVGVIAGNIVVMGLFQSVPLAASARSNNLVLAAVVLAGSVLGIGFMRLVRKRLDEDVSEGEPREPGEPSEPERDSSAASGYDR